MMLTDLSGGLNRRGIAATHHLNPYLEFKIPPVQDPACVCVDAVDGYGVLLFDSEGQAFRPEISSFHAEDNVECPGDEEPFTPTGIEPQPDPAAVLVLPVSGSGAESCDCGPETVQIVPTGIEPQADPAPVFTPPVSGSAAEDAACCDTDSQTVTPQGLEPQADPAGVARPKESGSERDRK